MDPVHRVGFLQVLDMTAIVVGSNLGWKIKFLLKP